MVIIGLLLLAAATVAGVEMTLSTRAADVGFEVFGNSFTMPLASVFLLGAVVMALALLGAFMITGALQRRRAVHRDARHRVNDENLSTRVSELDSLNADLVAENDRLRAEIAEHQRAEATLGGVAVPPGVGQVAYGDQVSDAVRSQTITETGRFDPYPTEAGAATTTGTRVGAAARDDVVDLDEADDKARVVGKFRNT
jgi:multisubunit Na+/H+ antiporter MnhC subunit